MKTDFLKLYVTLLCILTSLLTFGQVQMPKMPTPANFQVITSTQYSNSTSAFPHSNLTASQSNGMNLYEQDRKQVEQQHNEINQIYADLNNKQINYSLPSYSNIESAVY